MNASEITRERRSHAQVDRARRQQRARAGRGRKVPWAPVILRNLRNLDGEGFERLAIGAGGLVATGFGLYALIFPALGWLYLTDGFHFADPLSKAVGGAFILGVIAVIAAELVVAAAIVRMSVSGAWPARRFFLGPPAAAIALTATVLSVALALLL
jgi:hypothetical protein